MASSNEILQIEQINKGLTSLNDTINKTTESYLRLVKSIDEGSKATKNSSQTSDELDKARKKTIETNKEIEALNKQLVASSQKLQGFDASLYEQIQRNNKALTENKKAINEKIKAEDAEAGSLVRMTMRLKELEAAYVKTGTRTKEAQKEINDLSREIGKIEEGINKGQRSVGQYGKVWEGLKSLLPIVSVAAIGAAMKGLITNIVDVRKEFEKYEAVLTNTLGSNKAARQEMQMLQKFAAETPFALTELTEGFVKLTNYGLKPNKDELKNYGDLASSVGKGFKELVEGVADAVTGEFERLKEFGIKASKEGDKVSFVFKGQKVIVDNNAEAIKGYIQSLGKLEGVSGSMAAISATLGGRLSNLGDAWDNLMNAMGAGSSGIMTSVVNWAIALVDNFAAVFTSIKMIKEQVRDKAVTDGMNNAIKEIDVMTKSLVRNGIGQAEAHDKALKLYNESIEKTELTLMVAMTQATGAKKTDLQKRISLMGEERDAVKEHFTKLDQIKKPGTLTKEQSKKELDIKTASLELEAAKDKQITNQKLVDRKISEEQHKKELEAIELKFLSRKQQLYSQDAKEWTDIELQKQNISIKSRQEILKDIKSNVMIKNSAEREGQKDVEGTGLKSNQAYLDTTLKLAQKQAKDKKEIEETNKAMAIELATESINSVFSLNNMKFDKQLEQLEKEKNIKLSNEKLTAQQREKIEADYAKKVSDIKTKQAKSDKLQALFNVAINTAVAVMKITAEAALASPFLIPGIIAMGAIQASMISARPIPKYAKGTKSSESAGIFGEEGRELMVMTSGAALLAEKPTYFDGLKFKGSKIYSNPETEKMIRAMDHHSAGGRGMTDERILHGLNNLSEATKRVEKAILQKPVNIVDSEHRIIGHRMSNHQEIILTRLIRK